MGIIRELSPSLVNQIAAGEVVERPASVLKELLENSLDAGATRISVLVEPGGADLIQVQDNGSGILRDDLPCAFLRHATSKISSFDDLVVARTLGFRGEALAAISSVSRVTIESRHASESVGTRMVIAPDGETSVSDWLGPVGTSIAIRDLFSNLPVRRKFLKSAQTETGHLVETMNRLAMGFYECQFDMATPTRKILSLEPRTSPFLRLLDLYPSISEEDLVVHEIEGEGRRVQVFLLRPDKVRKDRQYQHLFINRRWVRHPGLFEAITQGGGGKISRDIYVGAWVYLGLEPDKLDINVHPTKREVRLLEADRIFSLVKRAVEESFSLFDSRLEGLPVQRSSPDPSLGVSSRSDGPKGFQGSLGDSSWTPQLRESKSPVFPRPSERLPLKSERRAEGFEIGSSKPSYERLPEVLKGLPFVDSPGEAENLSVLGQIAGTYLVIAWGQDLAIVDWHTAHERINYEKFRQQIESEGVSTIALLFPLVYRVPLSVADNLDNRLEELARLGFELDRTGPDSFRIRSVPFLLEGEDPVEVLNGLRENSGDFELPVLRSDRMDEVLMTVSCHSSVRKNDALDGIDGGRLVRELLSTPHPYTCPHGRPTMMRLSKEDLDQWFGR